MWAEQVSRFIENITNNIYFSCGVVILVLGVLLVDMVIERRKNNKNKGA